MKLIFYVLMMLLMLLSSIPLYSQEVIDYCYKPSKPLFLSTAKSKKRYAEDLQEYQRCQQHFFDMKQRTDRLKKESDANRQAIIEHH